jgi:hypothetical protein
MESASINNPSDDPELWDFTCPICGTVNKVERTTRSSRCTACYEDVFIRFPVAKKTPWVGIPDDIKDHFSRD